MKIITLTAFILLTALSFAQTSSFTIFNNNGQQFFVIMNGIRQNSIPQTNVKISGMNMGAYEVKLIFADGKTGDINKKLYLDTIADFQARVVFKGKKGKLQWYGMTTSGAPAGGTNIQYRPNDQSVYSDQQTSSTQSATSGGQGTVPQNGTQISGGQGTVQQGGTSSQGQGTMTSTTTVSDPSMSGSGTAGMTTSTTVTDPTMNGGTGNVGTTMTVTDPNNPNLPTGQAGGNININVNMNMSDPMLNGGQGTHGTTITTTDGTGTTTTTVTSSSSTTTTTGGTTTMTQNGTWGENGQGTVTTSGEKHGGAIVTTNGTQNGGYSCITIMTNVDDVVAKIKKMSFDSEKREYIENDLKSTCVTADQAYRIVNALTFDSDRMEMCMFFYDRMTDKANGHRLLPLLTYEMDQEEFRVYMSTH